MLPGVPRTTQILKATILVTDLLGAEVEVATDQRQVRCVLSKHGQTAHARDWLVSLTRPNVKTPRLFDSGPSRPLGKRVKLIMC